MNIHLAAFCSRTLFINNPKHDDDGVKSLTVDDHPGTFDILETDLVVRKKLDYYLVIPKGDCT